MHKRSSNLFSIAFYNLENLFDTKDDPHTLDDDFTAKSYKKWTKKRLEKKLKKLGKVISNISYDTIGFPPVILGVAEVENEDVLERLAQTKFLKKKGYECVHFDSPDERGIDTGLLYRSDFFEVLEKKVHPLYLFDETGRRDYTRDILYVYGKLQHQQVHILVNHWPSRRKGVEETEPKRIAAAQKNRAVAEQILKKDPSARIIIMGDFNDDPFSESLKVLSDSSFFNPMQTLMSVDKGSLTHQGNWYLFDQIVVSHSFLKGHQNPFQFKEARIFKPDSIQEYKGRFKGSPFRTYIGKKYLGGFSDHFPVYAVFDVQKKMP